MAEADPVGSIVDGTQAQPCGSAVESPEEGKLAPLEGVRKDVAGAQQSYAQER